MADTKHKINYLVKLISIYKIAINSLRIITGVLIFYFRGNIKNMMLSLFNIEVSEDSKDTIYNYLSLHISNPTIQLALLLGYILIIFSIFEMILSIRLLFNKKNSSLWLFVTSIIWIPVELLFISKFLFIHKTTAIILDALVLLALFKIIMAYYKKK